PARRRHAARIPQRSSRRQAPRNSPNAGPTSLSAVQQEWDAAKKNKKIRKKTAVHPPPSSAPSDARRQNARNHNPCHDTATAAGATTRLPATPRCPRKWGTSEQPRGKHETASLTTHGTFARYPHAALAHLVAPTGPPPLLSSALALSPASPHSCRVSDAPLPACCTQSAPPTKKLYGRNSSPTIKTRLCHLPTALLLRCAGGNVMRIRRCKPQPKQIPSRLFKENRLNKKAPNGVKLLTAAPAQLPARCVHPPSQPEGSCGAHISKPLPGTRRRARPQHAAPCTPSRWRPQPREPLRPFFMPLPQKALLPQRVCVGPEHTISGYFGKTRGTRRQQQGVREAHDLRQTAQ
ncbi:uncharacterized protein Tco025E_09342, partial [Trypanosoma conorhini]